MKLRSNRYLSFSNDELSLLNNAVRNYRVSLLDRLVSSNNRAVSNNLRDCVLQCQHVLDVLEQLSSN